jgi:hypothetical protein
MAHAVRQRQDRGGGANRRRERLHRRRKIERLAAHQHQLERRLDGVGRHGGRRRQGEVAADVGKKIIETIQSLANVRAIEDLEQRIIQMEAKAL